VTFNEIIQIKMNTRIDNQRAMLTQEAFEIVGVRHKTPQWK